MKTSTAVSSLAVLGIIGFGALGTFAIQDHQNTVEKLDATTQAAQSLKELKSAADQSSPELADLANQQLEKLPESARELANAPEESSSEDISQLTQETSHQLYDLAVSHPADENRAALISASIELWDSYQEQTQSPESLPEWVTEDDAATSSCLEADERTDAPESVSAYMESTDALLYAAQIYDARSDLTGDSQDERQSLADQLKTVTLEQQNLTEAVACRWKVPARHANYNGVDETKNQESLNNLNQQIKNNAQAVLEDTSVPTDSKVFRMAFITTLAQ